MHAALETGQLALRFHRRVAVCPGTEVVAVHHCTHGLKRQDRPRNAAAECKTFPRDGIDGRVFRESSSRLGTDVQCRFCNIQSRCGAVRPSLSRPTLPLPEVPLCLWRLWSPRRQRPRGLADDADDGRQHHVRHLVQSQRRPSKLQEQNTHADTRAAALRLRRC